MWKKKEAELKEKDIAIALDWKNAETVKCQIDREQMLRVLDNLVENACKYAQPKEALRLRMTVFLIKNQRLCIDFFMTTEKEWMQKRSDMCLNSFTGEMKREMQPVTEMGWDFTFVVILWKNRVEISGRRIMRASM